MISAFNPKLKCFFIVFNIILAVLGCILFILGILGSHYQGRLSSSILITMALLMILTPCLGALWAFKENKLMLKVYCGLCVFGGAGLLTIGTVMVFQAPRLKDFIRSNMGEIKRAVMLDQKLQDNLNSVESYWSCCGVLGYYDWGRDLPESCRCSSEDQTSQDLCVQVLHNQHGDMYVYREPCSPVILYYVDIAIKISHGLFFGFGVALLVGMLLCIVLFKVRYYPHHN